MNFANGGTFTFGNDIASQNTFVSLLTITPRTTASEVQRWHLQGITARVIQ